ncbi:MAG: efflux transporter outer membrane subunit [Methylovulum sp.]|nr:efflux transporter outer membrane subunit [Methylovulum sp.]
MRDISRLSNSLKMLFLIMGITIIHASKRRAIGIIGLGLLLPACMVGPDYRQPATSLPKAWLASQGRQILNGAETELAWWRHFHDPVLNQLITKATRGNWDVKMASARIAEARAVRASSDAALFPVGDMMASANRQANQIGFPDSAPASLSSAVKQPFNIFKMGFDASWELDLFGGHRREAESAQAELEASSLAHDDIVISVLAEVARTYIEIRQSQTQLQIAQQIADSNKQTTSITHQVFNMGETAGMNVSIAEAQQQQVQAQIPYYRSLLAQSEFSLDVLLGEQSGAAHGLIKPIPDLPVGDKQLLLAAPASVIAQRPDIRNAERKLASATAQQGVAMAKFFPDISLIGFIGLFNTNAGNLLNVSSKSWSVGGNVLWPILSYGSLSANLATADAKQQEALANYQKSVIRALSDVERSFSAYIEQEKYTQSVENAVAAELTVYKIARGRYEQGLASFLEVLDVQRNLYTAQSQLILAQAQTAQNLIAVYKSLGGSWKPTPVSGVLGQHK